MSTTTLLHDDISAPLRTLARINLDSARAHEAAAARIDDESIASALRDIGSVRRHAASELDRFITLHGEMGAGGDATAATLRRRWMDPTACRIDFTTAIGEAPGGAAVRPGSDAALLAAALRSETSISNAYARVLASISASPVISILEQHASTLERDVRRIADLLAAQ